jgi:hypothetical protein
MKHIFNNDFIIICTQIISEDKTPEQWALIESGDMFQCNLHRPYIVSRPNIRKQGQIIPEPSTSIFQIGRVTPTGYSKIKTAFNY